MVNGIKDTFAPDLITLGMLDSRAHEIELLAL